MMHTYNIVTGSMYTFDQSGWVGGNANNLPYREAALLKNIRHTQSQAQKSAYKGTVVKKNGLTVYELNVKTGALREAEMTQMKNGHKKLVVKKDYDYFQSMSREKAEDKARKLYLKKY